MFLDEYVVTQLPIVGSLQGVRSIQVEKSLQNASVPNLGDVLVRIEFNSVEDFEDALRSEHGAATAENIRRFHLGPIEFMLTTRVESWR